MACLGRKVYKLGILFLNVVLICLAKLLRYTRVIGGSFESCGGALWIVEVLGALLFFRNLVSAADQRKRHYLFRKKLQNSKGGGIENHLDKMKDAILEETAIFYTILVFNMTAMLGYFVLSEILRHMHPKDVSFVISSNLPVAFMFLL